MLFMETSPIELDILIGDFFSFNPKIIKKNEFTRRTRSL